MSLHNNNAGNGDSGWVLQIKDADNLKPHTNVAKWSEYEKEKFITAVYNEHHSFLMRVIKNVISNCNNNDILTIVNDCFIAFYSALLDGKVELDQIQNLKAYLGRMARYKSLNWLKKNRPLQELTEKEYELLESDFDDSPSLLLKRMQVENPEAYQLCLEYYGSDKVDKDGEIKKAELREDMAEELGVPYSTLRKRVGRKLAELREIKKKFFTSLLLIIIILAAMA